MEVYLWWDIRHWQVRGSYIPAGAECNKQNRASSPLQPGEKRILDFKMPYTPIPANDQLVAQLRAAKFDTCLKRTVAFWNGILSSGIEIHIPESKVENTFKASLIYDLIARNKEEGYYIQKVNDLHYHAFWIRDAAHIIHMYLLSGYPEIARQCLDFFPRWQQPA